MMQLKFGNVWRRRGRSWELALPASLRNLAQTGLWLALGMCAGMGAGCNRGGAGGPPPNPGVEVVIDKPSLAAVEDILSALGSVESNEKVELKPKASGLIEAVHFTEGTRVKKGQKLFELDSRKEAASVAQTQAEENLARANVARARTLVGTKAISQQELDLLESQVAVRTASHQLEQERWTERTILAPFDGVMGPRLVSPGQYVNIGASLATLVDDSPVKVRVRIPERQLGVLRVGQEGRVHVAAYSERVFTGKIDLIHPEVDEATRTVEIRLVVPNPESALKPGMFARVEMLIASRTQAVVIPESALIASLDRFSVYVVSNEVARIRPVRLGVRMPGKVEVREGLSAEQPMVMSGTQQLVDGMKVIAAKTAPPPEAAQP